MAFGAVLAASVAQRLWLTRHSWFYLDDWPLALQARHLGAFVDPYNGHLSVVMLTVYRLQMELFGSAPTCRCGWSLASPSPR